jgi:Metalloenzyme superfamily
MIYSRPLPAILFALFTAFTFCAADAQPPPKTRHLFIVTIDGFRWQEIFNGADPLLVANENYVRDTALTRQLFWDTTPELRRRRLMPFLWNTIAEKGQLYGNRAFNNNVNVKNFLKISYPGYNEMLTGHTDALTSPNLAINNPNVSVLEYLNNTRAYHGKVAVFTSWNIFPYILNETRSLLPVNSGYSPLAEKDDTIAALIDSVQKIMPGSHTRYDLLTYLSAREYMDRHHPSVVFLGLGETDEFAHQGRYDLYLQRAANADRMIAELWYAIQTDPFYKDSTTLLITTDHGRGRKTSTWTTHGFWAKGSGEIWLAVLGPDIIPEGELKTPGQVFQKELASTIALLLGNPPGAAHPPGKPIYFPAVSPIPADSQTDRLAAGR